MKTLLSSIPAILFLSFLSACGTSVSETEPELQPVQEQTTPTDSVEVSEETIAITTFEDLPLEFIDCTCVFAHHTDELKKGRYIYVSNFNETAYMIINGERVKFTQTFYEESEGKTTEKSDSELYTLTVETLQQESTGKGSLLHTSGSLTLTNKKGESMTWPFYGECGC